MHCRGSEKNINDCLLVSSEMCTQLSSTKNIALESFWHLQVLIGVPKGKIRWGWLNWVSLQTQKKRFGFYHRVSNKRTLWCQIRTAQSLLRPVVECPLCWFLWTMFFSFCTLWFLSRPCFSLQSPCGFYSDRVFSNCYIKSATVISDLRLVIPLWFLSGPRFSGSVLCGFYKEWGFFLSTPCGFYPGYGFTKFTHDVFILPMCTI